MNYLAISRLFFSPKINSEDKRNLFSLFLFIPSSLLAHSRFQPTSRSPAVPLNFLPLAARQPNSAVDWSLVVLPQLLRRTQLLCRPQPTKPSPRLTRSQARQAHLGQQPCSDRTSPESGISTPPAVHAVPGKTSPCRAPLEPQPPRPMS
jgi:hypothetical protein